MVNILRFARTRDLYIFAALVHRAAQPAEAAAAGVTLLNRSACPENAPGAPPPRKGRAGGVASILCLFSVKFGSILLERGKMLERMILEALQAILAVRGSNEKWQAWLQIQWQTNCTSN